MYLFYFIKLLMRSICVCKLFYSLLRQHPADSGSPRLRLPQNSDCTLRQVNTPSQSHYMLSDLPTCQTASLTSHPTGTQWTAAVLRLSSASLPRVLLFWQRRRFHWLKQRHENFLGKSLWDNFDRKKNKRKPCGHLTFSAGDTLDLSFKIECQNDVSVDRPDRVKDVNEDPEATTEIEAHTVKATLSECFFFLLIKNRGI